MSDYTRVEQNGQLAMCSSSSEIVFPCRLDGFIHKDTKVHIDETGLPHMEFIGELKVSYEESFCPKCGRKMSCHEHPEITLDHIPFGLYPTSITVKHTRFYCRKCRESHQQNIPFKANDHRMTKDLHLYIIRLLATGIYTNKAIAQLANISENTVKAIDKKRLYSIHTIDGLGKELSKPRRQARYLGIDEFLLHEGRKYATHISDLETGEVLMVAESKAKEVVYRFIEHVGEDWMKGVKAIACDMNADFAAAFKAKCPWINIVYDFFHIRKNLGDKLITPVRLDEYRRLKGEGREEEANAFKGARYILLSNRETLQLRDKMSREDAPKANKSSLFYFKKHTKKELNMEAWYDKLIKENKLITTLDIVKEELRSAYKLTSRAEMARKMTYIIKVCYATGNKHFKWFANLLISHICGIISHADIAISSGRIEGLNNRIKTLRRQGYGYRDDEYFFLKIMDISNSKYARIPAYHEFWY